MQFLVIAQDHKESLSRRLAVRDEHVTLGDKMKAAGNYIMGVALLDESGDMCGSVMVLDYPSRKEVDEWLENEPYVISGVWSSWTVQDCMIGPSFLLEGGQK